jgi:hypothetical protein
MAHSCWSRRRQNDELDIVVKGVNSEFVERLEEDGEEEKEEEREEDVGEQAKK